MKKLILLPIILMVSACFAQTTKITVDFSKIHNDTFVTCTSRLDHSEIDYLKSQRVDVKSTILPDVVISQVTDINGVHWSVNQIEWTNYDCTSKVLQ